MKGRMCVSKRVLLLQFSLLRRIRRLRGWWWKVRFCWEASATLKTLKMGQDVHFAVPVGVEGGKGELRIGAHVGLGCKCATVGERRRTGYGTVGPVVIGNNVWLGSRVMVLRGASIGDNSVVGAGSVVTKSLPANFVAAGVPARVVRPL